MDIEEIIETEDRQPFAETDEEDAVAPIGDDLPVSSDDDEDTDAPSADESPVAFEEEEDEPVNAVSIDDVEDEDEAADEDEGLDGPVDPRVRVLSEKQSGEAIAVSGDDVPKPAKRPARRRWYIVHTYSGHENKVKVNLERRIESMNMQDKIFRVEVPNKTVTKIKDGKRTEREERIFPGYVLVEMIMDDDSWYVVRHTPGVTKFVGSQKKPIPAKDVEIKRILLRSQPAAAVAKIEIDLKIGEVVRIISGPFADFEGTVTEVSPEKERLKASVSIFGRETPVELAFNQVQKLN